jgi:hypothetical protein
VGESISAGGPRKKKTDNFSGWELEDHTCNPSYSGGRNQEDCTLGLQLIDSLLWDFSASIIT